MDIAAIRTAMANAVGAIAGMQHWPIVPGSIVAPAFAAGEVTIDYDRTFKGGQAAGLTEMLVKGRLYAATADTPTGQATLDSFLTPSGALSVKAAIEADLTLAGTVRTLRVERVHGYAVYSVGGTDYYGAQFDVRVWAL
jgi:hypothetical protein